MKIWFLSFALDFRDFVPGLSRVTFDCEATSGRPGNEGLSVGLVFGLKRGISAFIKFDLASSAPSPAKEIPMIGRKSGGGGVPSRRIGIIFGLSSRAARKGW